MSTMSASPEPIEIPTRSFYSARQVSPKSSHIGSKENEHKSPIASNSSGIKRRSIQNQSSINTNKGVKHKIRRRPVVPLRPAKSLEIDSILCNIRNENLRNRIETKRVEKEQVQKVHDILRKCRNPIELARPLSALNMSDDSNNNNADIKNGPYSMEVEDFSDFDTSSTASDTENREELAPEIVNDMENFSLSPVQQDNLDNANVPGPADSRPQTPNGNKFFKSRQTANIPKEVRITENIKALVCNGKITLISEKRKLPKRQSAAADFSVAQAAVNDIIKNLDDHSESGKTKAQITVVEHKNDNQENLSPKAELLNESELLDHTDYSDFRKRIPFKTDDPVKIEEQHFLLDFLITHNICNEENFNIFITDSENHKNEAMKIVNEVLNDDSDENDFRQRIPFNTEDPLVIEQQNYFFELLTKYNLMTEENFDIFIANYEKRRSEAEEILANILSTDLNTDYVETYQINNGKQELESNTDHDIDVVPDTNSFSKENIQSPRSVKTSASSVNSSLNSQNLFPIFYGGSCQPLGKKFTRSCRTWKGGHGSSQYQIDAGQKEFGAKQCKQCGLVYGAHEPEEEKLHRDFHSSLHVLRFKGWIDEDRVADYPEWGRDGRIIRITESASNKRRERLNEILKIVDKELGFSSYIIPKTFAAYLAVRNSVIVGFCLVQPLNKANRYIRSNNVDCCTIEEFEAKCGISRIWVAPLHRRMHIAKKLLQAVQLNTIVGEEIPKDKIAFSAPTEDGKHFAQKITGTESFLVYQ